jgi:DNA-binding response OmpR family regulator
MPEKILIVEDEARIARWTQTYVENAGYECLVAYNGRDALYLARHEKPDLVVLDLMIPEMDGWTVCKILRQESDIPIIMVTAKTLESDIINGLKIGADDYITKPFSPAELVARIEAALRRAKGRLQPTHTVKGGNIELDLSARLCRVNGKMITLTTSQFELLHFFLQHPNQVLSREQIITNVFGLDFDSFDRAVDIHIRRLRTRIEPDPSNPTYIQTVFGAGYRFCPDKEN